jgi:hypothetical protein
MCNYLIYSMLGRLWKSLEGLLRIVGSNPAGPTICFVMRNGWNTSIKGSRRAKVAWFIAASWLSLGAVPYENALKAQDASAAQPAPSPAQQAVPESAPSPTPEPQIAPDLLPESKTLPPLTPASALPPDLIPERPKPVTTTPLPSPGSAEQQEKDKIRFRQIRTIAVRDPFAIYLAKRASEQKTLEDKRAYFRAYYIVMAARMRKLEPRLKPLIDAFEFANVGRYSPTLIRPTVPLRDLSRFEKKQAAAGIVQ